MGAVRRLGNSLPRGERGPPFPAPRIGRGRRQARWREALEGCGQRGRPGVGWGRLTPRSGRPGLGRAREGKWGAHGGAHVAVCAVRAGGAGRVHAACDFLVLCMRAQRLSRLGSVGVHGRFRGCVGRVRGARRV